MRYHLFAESETYQTAVLIKPTSFFKGEIQTYYVDALAEMGIQPETVIAFTLKTDELGKITAKFAKEYLDKLLEVVNGLGVTHLYVTDSTYFKALTRETKADPHLGYVLQCAVKGYEHMKVVLGINYRTLIFNPALKDRLTLSLKALSDDLNGNYSAIGSNIIHSEDYPVEQEDIETALTSLLDAPQLTVDIEAFSLSFNLAGVASIAFATEQHIGTAFLCDYSPLVEKSEEGHYGVFIPDYSTRRAIKEFFEQYKGTLIWHNAAYDLKVLIYSLWMKDALDMEGLLQGLEVMTKHFHDTKIIAYLSTNSTAGNELGLKTLAHSFAGNWAQDDIKDIRRIPPKDLLKYNLVDCLSTWFVYNKFMPMMIADNQQNIYETLMLPSLKTIIQMELCGMPMNMERVKEVKEILSQEEANHLHTLINSPVIKTVNLLLQTNAMHAANAKLKTKIHPIEKFADLTFNPNSGPQMQILLYEHLSLPVLDFTETKQPATGAQTLEKLVNHTKEPLVQDILNALIGYGKINKILTSFIPAFENALLKGDEHHYLHGSFNLGGTVSGRLSSSAPNLQNLPAGSTYGKLIKSCFTAPKGWLMVGADFNSLEDYISALTTKDKNKLLVYEQGFDGHSLRAAYYFRDQLPHIDLTDPKSVNTIKKDHENLRQDSKAPTFLLTYGGTYHGLMNNLGWSMEKAKAIEANYHLLYKDSDEYIQNRLKTEAAGLGYVTVAFGLRVRTPMLQKVIYGSKYMPYEAAAEARTAGNAMGQSYGLLNNRAANAFMQKVWASPYRHSIKPVALIHDAIYLMVKDDVNVVAWVNNELIKAMQWQDLPELEHPTVKLGAALDVFWPSWAEATTIPNKAERGAILALCAAKKQSIKEKENHATN